jgi:hypothetical protein
MANDVSVVSQIRENTKEKTLQNIIMCESGLMQKEAWQVHHLNMCSPKNG